MTEQQDSKNLGHDNIMVQSFMPSWNSYLWTGRWRRYQYFSYLSHCVLRYLYYSSTVYTLPVLYQATINTSSFGLYFSKDCPSTIFIRIIQATYKNANFMYHWTKSLRGRSAGNLHFKNALWGCLYKLKIQLSWIISFLLFQTCGKCSKAVDRHQPFDTASKLIYNRLWEKSQDKFFAI